MNKARLCMFVQFCELICMNQSRSGMGRTYATTPDKIVLSFSIGGSALVGDDVLGSSNICATAESVHAVPRNKVVIVSREQHGICRGGREVNKMIESAAWMQEATARPTVK